jgi:hypothetical protein
MSQLDRLRQSLLGRTPGVRPATVDNLCSGTLLERRQGNDASQLELLLGDIRGIFKEAVELPSADLVSRLVAIEGRPWGKMGRPRKALSQAKLARMLKPLGIGPDKIGPEDKRLNGYKRERFKDAFARYLPPEEASKPDSRTERDEMGTSERFQSGQPEPPVTASTNGGEQSLSSRRVQELAAWYVDQAYWHYSPNAIAAGELDAALRVILRKEVLPEHVEIELVRVKSSQRLH